jgi:hypothetical protein
MYRRLQFIVIRFAIVNAPESGVPRLDYFVARRLGMLRISRGELARRGGPSRSTLNKAITGARPLSAATLMRLDASLGWAPGSAAEILAGGIPPAGRSAAGDVWSAEHAHLLKVLQTLEDMLGDCRELVSELLAAPGTGRAG